MVRLRVMPGILRFDVALPGTIVHGHNVLPLTAELAGFGVSPIKLRIVAPHPRVERVDAGRIV